MATKSRVTVDGEVKTASGTSKNGKPYTERFQDAYLHVAGAKFPKSCKVMLYDNARPYAAGEYETEQDIEINEYGKLVVMRELVLHPAAQLAAAK